MAVLKRIVEMCIQTHDLRRQACGNCSGFVEIDIISRTTTTKVVHINADNKIDPILKFST